MLKNKLLKRVLCVTIVLIFTMSLSLGAFADGSTVPQTTIVNYTFMGYMIDLDSMIPRTVAYNSDGYSGTLNYSYYIVKNTQYDPGDYGFYIYNIDVVYSGNVTYSPPPAPPAPPASIIETTTFNYTFMGYMIDVDSMIPRTVAYNSDGYSGTLNYTYYIVKNMQYDPGDYGFYIYNIDAVYSGTVYR
jgi:hypothetical protein